MKKRITDEQVVKLLQKLPRENAPDDFEFKLMTRIKNRNFGDLEREEKSGLLWVVLPSASIVTAAVVVLMFMFSSVEENIVTTSVPQKINSASTKTYVVIEKEPVKAEKEIEAIKIVKAPNDVVTKQKIKIPVNSAQGVSVDNYLNKSIRGGGTAATLVSSEEKTPFEFREFLPYTALPRKNNADKRDSVKLREK